MPNPNLRSIPLISGGWPLAQCRQYNAQALAVLQQTLLPADVVVVAQAHTKFLEHGNLHGAVSQGLLAGWGQGLLEVHRHPNPNPDPNPNWEVHRLVEGQNASLVLLGDIGTSIKNTGIACFLNHPRHCNKPKAEVVASLQPLHGMYAALARNHSSIHFWGDQLDLICDTPTCSVLIPGTASLGIWDGNHLTTTASLYMWPFLCGFFRDAGLFRTSIPYSKMPPQGPHHVQNPAAAPAFPTDDSFMVLGCSSTGLLGLILALVVGYPYCRGPPDGAPA
jgi:hypothetical protein